MPIKGFLGQSTSIEIIKPFLPHIGSGHKEIRVGPDRPTLIFIRL